MSDYILREDAIEAAVEGADILDGGYNRYREGFIRDEIDKVPAADVRENVRGEWILENEDEYNPWELLRCSECDIGIFNHRYNFCPYCGADMRGERECKN